MKNIEVKDEFRKNPLSFIEGGSEVTVYVNEGGPKGEYSLTYTKIKKPSAYIARLKFVESIVRIEVNGNKVWDKSHLTKYWEQ